jgi:hypothetical protein
MSESHSSKPCINKNIVAHKNKHVYNYNLFPPNRNSSWIGALIQSVLSPTAIILIKLHMKYTTHDHSPAMQPFHCIWNHRSMEWENGLYGIDNLTIRHQKIHLNATALYQSVPGIDLLHLFPFLINKDLILNYATQTRNRTSRPLSRTSNHGLKIKLVYE